MASKWDAVPWMIAGAEHSADVARVVSHNAADGNEGIIQPEDLMVKALDTPGNQVRVLPGACNILNRTPGYPSELYTGRLPTEDVVDVGKTGSDGSRSDLVMARVEDPTLSGSEWDEPDDPASGPYIFTRVYPDVGKSLETVKELGKAWSAIPLARVDIPKSTATIEQSMITDLRFVANPKQESHLAPRPAVHDDPGLTLGTKKEKGEWFPNIGDTYFTIPSWATRMQVEAHWEAINYTENNAWGEFWIEFGDKTEASVREFATQKWRFNSMTHTDHWRANWDLYYERGVPKKLRGTKTLFVYKARYSENSTSKGVRLDGYSGVAMRVTFMKEPDQDVEIAN
jgi:hypothetical protein